MHFLNKMERKFGRFAIQGLMKYIILFYVAGYLIEFLAPQAYSFLTLEPFMIFHYGQVWRLVSWVLIPPPTGNIIFMLIMVVLYYQLGTALERTWGAFRFNVYIFGGMIFTVLGALLLFAIYGVNTPVSMGSSFSTYYINMSIFLAYAFTYPEQELLLYFIIPIKIKWFGFLYVAYIIYDIISAFRTSMNLGLIVLVLIAASLLNVVIYVILDKKSGRRPSSIKRKAQYNKSIKKAKPNVYANGARHKCAICGRTELDDPTLTFRYCSKCSGNKEYCQEHLFTHEHK